MKNIRCLGSGWLKLLAMVTMLADHIGAVLLTQGSGLYAAARIVGRTAFPVYAFLLAEGFRRTGDLKKYFLRLGALALISEVPFDMAFFGAPFCIKNQNVFLTLFLSLAALAALDAFAKKGQAVYGASLAAAFALAAHFLRADYGALGVVMVLVFYFFDGERSLPGAGIVSLLCLAEGGFQMAGFLGAGLTCLYNGKETPKLPKWFTYGFYPAHLTVLALILRLQVFSA